MDFELAERRRQGKIIQRKNPLSKEIKQSIYLLFFTLLSIIVILSIVYLLNTTQANQKGYALLQEQIKKEQLLSENENLLNKITEAKTTNKIEDSSAVKEMRKAENPQYIKLPKEE